MTLLAALQSAAQALPEDAPATAAQLAADAAPAAPRRAHSFLRSAQTALAQTALSNGLALAGRFQ